MCLITKQSTWLVAKKDIKCYKMLEVKRFLFIKSYMTTYRGMKVPKKVISGEKDLIAKGKAVFAPHFLSFGVVDYEISEGAIHAFSDLDAALIWRIEGCQLFECIIPAGTKYAVGRVTGFICAEKIRFVKKV